MHHERVLKAEILFVPRRAAQRVDRDDIASVVRQLVKQHVFLCGQLHGAAAACNRAAAPVDHRIPQPQTAVRALQLRSIGAAQHGSQAEHQLLRQEGLDDIVVRAQTQPAQPIRIRVTRGQEQHRDVPLTTQCLYQCKAVPVRQHDIEQHCIRSESGESSLRLGAAPGRPHLPEPGLRQDLPDQAAERRFVIDRQYFQII